MIKNKSKFFAMDGPWGSSSGNNKPGSGGGFSGGGNNDSIDDLLKDLKNKYKFKMPFKGGAKGISFLVLLAIIGWLATGFYRVEPDEQGVELLFGKWNESTTDPGLHYFFPTPIGKVLTPKVEAIRKINVGFRSNGTATRDVLEESMMLTSDQNISDLDYTVLYRIKDAGQFLFNLRDPEETVKVISESVLREVVGQTNLEGLLTVSRQSVERDSRSLLQELLDEYEVGILIQSIQLQDVNPAREVLDACDFAGSTGGMIDYVKKNQPKKVMLVTECSMSDNVQADNPNVEFIKPCNLCPYMKKITLQKILNCLENETNEVLIEEKMAKAARQSVQRMAEIGR